MSHPFHTQQPLSGSSEFSAAEPSGSPADGDHSGGTGSLVSRRGHFGLVGAIVTVAVVLLLLARQGQWPPSFLRDWLPGAGSQAVLFVAQPDLSREQAAALYRSAVANLQSGDYETALSQFKRLEPAYPALRDMLWLREAECYAGQGNEWAVQKKLNDLISQVPDSPLKTLAHYRIGQSQFRGGEREKAEETFTAIREDNSDSQYATGSLYYLGSILAAKAETRGKAAEPLRDYLRRYPDGKFSGDAAALLERLSPALSPEEHALIGLAYAASSKDATKTLAHLRQGTPNLTWLALGKLQIRMNQHVQGVQTLLSGLSYARQAHEVTEAVDAMLAITPTPDSQKALLKIVAAKPLTVGNDYALWKLAELEPNSAAAYYRQLLQQTPDGDYAPESAWRLLWPLLVDGRTTEYIEQARQYLARYGYARSAPKALFWIGKALEKSDAAEARKTYQQLAEQYPGSYYAFRAEGRLQALLNEGADPGWKIADTDDAGYPVAALNASTETTTSSTNPGVDLNNLNILPGPEHFGPGSTGRFLRQEAAELQHIGVAEDLRLFVSEALGELPPIVESWAEQIAGDRAKGIRVLRTALDAKARDDFHGADSGRPSSPSLEPLDSDTLKLLYPLYFSDFVSASAQREKLDPFLIQALMREESYFNEFAVSGSDARGLMQLLPSTAKDVARWTKLSGFKTSDLFLPAVNIRLGARYLSYLHSLFGPSEQASMPAVGAYNGGPGAMKGWVQTSPFFTTDPDMFVERIPYNQSRDYIKKVFASYWNYRRLYRH